MYEQVLNDITPEYEDKIQMYKVTNFCRLCLNPRIKIGIKLKKMPLGEKYYSNKSCRKVNYDKESSKKGNEGLGVFLSITTYAKYPTYHVLY